MKKILLSISVFMLFRMDAQTPVIVKNITAGAASSSFQELKRLVII
jgi:hypothetical protein